jgi:hypothetical protein
MPALKTLSPIGLSRRPLSGMQVAAPSPYEMRFAFRSRVFPKPLVAVTMN